jgi:V8-like Glu-specific endopeptidase
MRTSFVSNMFAGMAVTVAFGSAQALALPLGNGIDAEALGQAPQFGELESAAVDFTAIVALSNCSGSYVKFTTSLPTDKGMVLTNGHCFEGGFIDAGQIKQDVASSRTFRLLTSDGRGTVATLRAQRVMFATMTDTDITLYRLTQTIEQIKTQYGVEPLVISDQRPAAGAPMKVVSGYWKRIYTCNIDDFVNALKEGEWTFTDSIRYSSPGCETIGGTSGSPIIHSDTREVIGINNTGNEDGERCTLNNPCEVGADGQITVREGASYGQETYQIYSCLNDSNQIDLTKEGCMLPKGQMH